MFFVYPEIVNSWNYAVVLELCREQLNNNMMETDKT